MDAILPRIRFWHRREGSALDAIRIAIAGILTAVFLLAAVLLISRRMTGALIYPLPAAAMFAIGATIASIALGSRSLFPYLGQNDSASQEWFQKTCRWSASVSLVLIALAISVPGSSLVGLAALWLIVLGEELWFWKSYQRRADRVLDQSDRPGIASTFPTADAELVDQPMDEAEWQSTSLTQRLAFERTDTGDLAVEGWLRADFQAEQRIAVVHVAFCPPFAGTPQVEAEPLDGPDCTLRPTLVLPWGVRWEVKLDVPAVQPERVILGFHASERKE